MSEYRCVQREYSLYFTLPAQLETVDRVCKQVEAMLKQKGLEQDIFDIQLLIREVLNNCIIHGCGLDPGKDVYMEFSVGRDSISMQAEDPGEGFDWKETLNSCLPDDTCINGRGLDIVCLYADSVEFNQKGNRVQVKKTLRDN